MEDFITFGIIQKRIYNYKVSLCLLSQKPKSILHWMGLDAWGQVGLGECGGGGS